MTQFLNISDQQHDTIINNFKSNNNDRHLTVSKMLNMTSGLEVVEETIEIVDVAETVAEFGFTDIRHETMRTTPKENIQWVSGSRNIR